MRITDRDRESVGYVLRHGEAQLEQIRRKFYAGTSSPSHAYRRLKGLQDAGYLVLHRGIVGEPGVYRATAKGARLAGGLLSPGRLDLTKLNHQLAKIDLSEELLAEHPGAVWFTERELRAAGLGGEREAATGRTARGGKRGRIFDGLLLVPEAGAEIDGEAILEDVLDAGFEGAERVAVELELTRKKTAAYRPILEDLAGREDVDAVLFVCRSRTLAEKLKEVMAEIREGKEAGGIDEWIARHRTGGGGGARRESNPIEFRVWRGRGG